MKFDRWRNVFFIELICCRAGKSIEMFADDEASTRLLQILLVLLLSTASLMFIPCAVRSFITLSIHFFGCLPLLLVPATCPYSATTGSLFPSNLVTCPNHVSLLLLILSTNVTCCPGIFLVTRPPSRRISRRCHAKYYPAANTFRPRQLTLSGWTIALLTCQIHSVDKNVPNG